MTNVSNFAPDVQPTLGQITSSLLADALLAADLTAGSHFRLALVLWRSADSRGIVESSGPELAQAARIGERAISRELARIEATGLIRRIGTQCNFEWNLQRVRELANSAPCSDPESLTRRRISKDDEPRELVAAWLDGVRRGRGKGALVSSPPTEVAEFALERIRAYSRVPAVRRLGSPAQVARAYGESYMRCAMPLDRATGRRAAHPLTIGFLRNATAEIDVILPGMLRAERDRDLDRQRDVSRTVDAIDAREAAAGVAAAAGGAR